MQVLLFLSNPKDLDPSYKTDLDFFIVLEGKTSYNRRNRVFSMRFELGVDSSCLKGLVVEQIEGHRSCPPFIRMEKNMAVYPYILTTRSSFHFLIPGSGCSKHR